MYGDEPDLENRVVALGVRQLKGREFDAVLIAGPKEIVARFSRGPKDLCVALTRATQRLGILHEGQPPAVLEGTVAPLA